MEKMNYTSSEVEVLDVVIEKGFANSTDEFEGEWVSIF